MNKNKINRKYLKPESSKVGKFRQYWSKKGYDLINITYLLTPKLCISGWCNSFNEPDETVHHIQLYYRNENVANMSDGIEIIDDNKYLVFYSEKCKCDNLSDFIIFRKVKNK